MAPLRFASRVDRRRAGTVGVVVLITVSFLALGVLSGTASSTNHDRNIERTELPPGESTNVTVTIDTGGETEPEVLEEFSPAFAEVVVRDVSPFPAVRTVRDDNSGLAVIWDDPDADAAAVTYEVAVPDDAADGATFEIAGGGTVDEIAVVAGGDTDEASLEGTDGETGTSPGGGGDDSTPDPIDNEDETAVSGEMIPGLDVVLIFVVLVSATLLLIRWRA